MMNKIRRFSVLVLALLVATAFVACDEEEKKTDGDEDAGTEDVNDPTISMDNLEQYTAMVGTMSIEVTAEDAEGVARVDLLIGEEIVATSEEAPYTISWDTTATDDGLVEVFARVTDTAGKTADTDVVPVVVINNGEVPTFDEGNTGEMVIPEDWDATVDTHVKHHWGSEIDYSHILAVFLSEPEDGQSDWEITIDLGTGYCPHSGESLATSDAITDVPAVFDAEPDGGFPAATMFFVHMGGNPEEHIGETLPYEIRLFAFFE